MYDLIAIAVFYAVVQAFACLLIGCFAYADVKQNLEFAKNSTYTKNRLLREARSSQIAFKTCVAGFLLSPFAVAILVGALVYGIYYLITKGFKNIRDVWTMKFQEDER